MTRQLRVVPVGKAVEATSAVATYDSIRELVKDKELLAVAPCICRKQQGLLGRPCDRPPETCLAFDVVAQTWLENGLARRITRDELMDILDLGEENGLVLSPTNSENILNVCMCCGCCCGLLRALKKYPRPADYVQSSFHCRVDSQLCNGCGTCEDRCQMGAIKERSGLYEVDVARCIGCGLCASTCPQEAISLVPKQDVAPLAANYVELQFKMAADRGSM